MSTAAQGLPTDGQRLALIRHKLGLSQTEMGERLGVSLRTYQDLEKAAEPRIAYLLAAEFIALQMAVERANASLATPHGRHLATQVATLTADRGSPR